ncbi:SseB family protein [Actinoplanes nipponensis]|uniref:SseB family protein n=1 Tax=Actinoplanes nipponensis TaxID=135950 RepID=UPI001EF1C03F|nr:SseB family protein [Actinoplanes nipponensis]
MTEWEPATDAEIAMRNALRTDDQESYFRILAGVDLLLPVSADALAGLAPLGWGTWSTGGRTHVLAFTSPAALQACLADYTGSARRVAYAELADTWPNLEWWLAVNPGLPIEGYLPAWFVAQLSRGDLRLPTRGPGREGSNAPNRIQDLHAAATLAATAAAQGYNAADQSYAAAAAGGPIQAGPASSGPGHGGSPHEGAAASAGAVSAAQASSGAPAGAAYAAGQAPSAPEAGPGGQVGPGGLPLRTPGAVMPSGLPSRVPGAPADPGGGIPGGQFNGFGTQPGDRQAPGGDRQASGGDRQASGGDRQASGGDRQAPGGDRPGQPGAGSGSAGQEPRGFAGQPGEPSARPGGAWPGGVQQPGGAQPGGMQAGGMQPGGAQPGGAQPGGMPGAGRPGDMQRGGVQPLSGAPARPGDVPAAYRPPSVPTGGFAGQGGAGAPTRPASGASALDALGSRSGPGAPADRSAAPSPAGGPPASSSSGLSQQRPDSPLPTRTPMAQTPPLPAHIPPPPDTDDASAGSGRPASGPAGDTTPGQTGAGAISAGPRDTVPAGPRDAVSAGPRDAVSAGPRDAVSAGPHDAISAGSAGAISAKLAGPGGAISAKLAGPSASEHSGSAPSSAERSGSPARPGADRPGSEQGADGRGTGPGGLPRRQVTPPEERPASMAAAAQALAAKGSAGSSPAPTTQSPSAQPSSPQPSSAGQHPPASQLRTDQATANQPGAAQQPRPGLAPPVIPGAGGAARSTTAPVVPAPAARPTVPPSTASTPAPPGQAPALPPDSQAASPTGSRPETQPAGPHPTGSRTAAPASAGSHAPGAGPDPAIPGGAPATIDYDDDFVPANEVERDLYRAVDEASTDSFLSTLLLATVLVPVANNSRPGSAPGESGFAFRTEEIDGDVFLVVFTSRDRLAEHFAEPTRTVGVRFVDLIRNWPDPAWSFAVNPTSPIGARYPGPQVIALASWAVEAGLGGDPVDAPAAQPQRPAEPSAQLTVMQKAVPAEQIDYYLERGYDRVAGFVHRAGEVEHLREPGELFAALGLLYDGSPYRADAKEAFVLRWPAHRPSLYRIPYGGQSEQALRAMDGWVIERPPFRGNGFAPGEGKDVIAEFKVDSVRLPHGAELWRIVDGAEQLIAVFDCDAPMWRRVGEQ